MVAKVRKSFGLIAASIAMLGFFVFAPVVIAAEYGNGNYGSGLYGSGDSTVPETPAPEETPSRTVVTGSYAPGTSPYVDTSACRTGDLFSAATGARCPVSTSTTAPSPTIFTRNLYQGMTGEDAKALQQYLNTKGFVVAVAGGGSVGNETTLFGPATKAALIKFQVANNILPATGAFGPQTRAFLAKETVVVPPVVLTTTVTSTPVNLNVRVAPINGAVLGTVPQGTAGTVLTTSGAWTKVRFSTGLEGWVYQPLLK